MYKNNFKLNFHQTLLQIFRQRFITKNWRNKTEKSVVRNGFIHHAEQVKKLTDNPQPAKQKFIITERCEESFLEVQTFN